MKYKLTQTNKGIRTLLILIILLFLNIFLINFFMPCFMAYPLNAPPPTVMPDGSSVFSRSGPPAYCNLIHSPYQVLVLRLTESIIALALVIYGILGIKTRKVFTKKGFKWILVSISILSLLIGIPLVIGGVLSIFDIPFY